MVKSVEHKFINTKNVKTFFVKAHTFRHYNIMKAASYNITFRVKYSQVILRLRFTILSQYGFNEICKISNL